MHTCDWHKVCLDDYVVMYCIPLQSVNSKQIDGQHGADVGMYPAQQNPLKFFRRHHASIGDSVNNALDRYVK